MRANRRAAAAAQTPPQPQGPSGQQSGNPRQHSGPPEPPRHRPWGPPAPAQNRFAPLAQEPTYRETEWPVYANDYRPCRQHQGQPKPHFKKHPSGHKNGKGAPRQPRDTPATPALQPPAKTPSRQQQAPPCSGTAGLACTCRRNGS
ncbi:basic salivary proline-rich protein 4-like [Bacillus rossius redtenbacheri]|uniref:basic salivary proline-rich protein 4-like n=1 Tax=Bacillus rossius redtenbacheri TaxID=93214 RepID=UPI002FDDDAFA